jgi:hypothetical protein
MEDAGVIKLYEPSPTPCLYVADVQNMVGRVPLMPLFLAGNSTPTIPHIFSKRKDSGFPYGCADAAATDGRRGSNVYEVNPRQAPPGRSDHRRDHSKEGCCQQCTAQACSSDSTSLQGESSLIRSTWCCMIVCTSMYEYVQVYTRMCEYVQVCISIIRGCKYSWSAHIFLSFLAPTYNVLCLGDAQCIYRQ